jgi:AcrR family transcriptional regulator
MKEGDILKAYLDSKKINKQKFATRLKMSKQNLYQLFDSKELQPETKANLEAVTGLKWQEIEQAGKQMVNIAVNVSKRNGFPGNIPDYRDDLIALLKERLNSSERQLLQYAMRNQALLRAIAETLPQLLAKVDKIKLQEAHEEMNKRIERHLDVLKKESI